MNKSTTVYLVTAPEQSHVISSVSQSKVLPWLLLVRLI